MLLLWNLLLELTTLMPQIYKPNWIGATDHPIDHKVLGISRCSCRNIHSQHVLFSIRIGLFWKWETIFDWPLFKTFYKDKGRKWFYARQCICKMIDCLFIVWDLWDCKKASLACHRRIATPNHTTHVQNGHSCWEGNITRFENQSLPFVDKKCDKNRDKHKEERTKINSTRERDRKVHTT